MTSIDRKVNFTAGDKSGVASIQAAALAAKALGLEVAKADTATDALNDALKEAARSSKLSSIAKDAAKYAAETGNARTAQVKLNAELTKANATQSEIARAARAYHNEIGNINREMQRQEETAKRIKETVGKYGGKFGREQFGDISTSLSSFGSVTGAFGTNAPTELLRLGGDSFGVAEYAGRFKTSLREAGEQITESTGKVGGLATGLQGLIPGLGAAGAGIAAVALVVLPFVAAMGAIAVALAEADKQAKAMNESFKIFNAQREAERNVQKLTTDEARDALEAAKKRAAEEQKIVSDNTAIYNQFYKEAQSNIPVIGDLAARFHESRGAFEDLNESTEGAKAALAEANAEVAALEAILKKGVATEGDRAAAIKKANEDLEAAEKELETVREQHGETIAQLTAQEDELNAAYTRSAIQRSVARGQADGREREDRDRAAERAAQDLAKVLEAQAQAHQNNLLTIEKRAADAITSARQALAQKEIQAYQQIAAAQAAYQKQQAESLRKFQTEQKRALENFQRDEQRARQDYRRSQLENLINNDVTGAILDQDAYRTDRRRGRQDFRRDTGRSQEDFDAEQQKQFEALQERIAGIQQELEAFRLATAEKIIQIEAQKVADLEAAQAAFDEKMLLDQAARDLQKQRDDEDLQLKLDRRAEDRRHEDAAAAAALQSSLDKIGQQKTAQDLALDSAIAKANAFKLIVESTRLPTGVAPTAGNPVPTFPGYGGYIPTPGSEKFYEDPGQGPPKTGGTGGLGGVQFAGASALGRAPRSMGSGGGQTIIVNIDGKPAGGSYKPLVDAIANGIRAAINNPQVGTP